MKSLKNLFNNAAIRKIALAVALTPALTACAATDFSKINDNTCVLTNGHSFQGPVLGTSDISQQIDKDCMSVKAFEQSHLVPAQLAGRPLSIHEELLALKLHGELSPTYKQALEQALARHKQKSITQMTIQAGDVSCVSVNQEDSLKNVTFACTPVAPPPPGMK